MAKVKAMITVEMELEPGLCRDSDSVLKIKEALNEWMIETSIHNVGNGEEKVIEGYNGEKIGKVQLNWEIK